MIDLFFEWLGSLAEQRIVNPLLASFVSDGICAGLGSVLVFIQPIFMLFFARDIPAIMATRSIESEKDRIITILVNPLMSCNARLPVYVLIAGVIFGTSYAASAAVFSMYADMFPVIADIRPEIWLFLASLPLVYQAWKLTRDLIW